MSDSSTGPGRPGLSARRFREMVLEASLIVFAVIVALAAEEWWEDRERAARAAAALDAVAAEIEGNLMDLRDNAEQNDSAWVRMQRAIRSDSTAEAALALNTLSADVWETVRLNGATEALAIDVLARIAELYNVQGYYLEVQSALDDAFRPVIAGSFRGEEDVMARLGPDLLAAEAFRRVAHCYLERAYVIVLGELDDGVRDPRRLSELLDERDIDEGDCGQI